MGEEDFSSSEPERLSAGTAAAPAPHPSCCTSPAAACYWLVASAIAWGALSLAGLYWRPLGARSASTLLLAAGIGCVANWLRHRTFHCGITAPLFLIAGGVFLLSDVRILRIQPGLVWPLVICGTAAAFLLEWKYARPANKCMACSPGLRKPDNGQGDIGLQR